MTTVILVGLIVVLLAAAAYVGVLLLRRTRSAQAGSGREAERDAGRPRTVAELVRQRSEPGDDLTGPELFVPVVPRQDGVAVPAAPLEPGDAPAGPEGAAPLPPTQQATPAGGLEVGDAPWRRAARMTGAEPGGTWATAPLPVAAGARNGASADGQRLSEAAIAPEARTDEMKAPAPQEGGASAAPSVVIVSRAAPSPMTATLWTELGAMQAAALRPESAAQEREQAGVEPAPAALPAPSPWTEPAGAAASSAPAEEPADASPAGADPIDADEPAVDGPTAEPAAVSRPLSDPDLTPLMGIPIIRPAAAETAPAPAAEPPAVDPAVATHDDPSPAPLPRLAETLVPDDDVVVLLPPTPTGRFPVVSPPVSGSSQPVWFRVVRRDGEPVPAAVVALLDGRGREVDTTKTATDGGGELHTPHGGRFLMIVSADGYQPRAAALSVDEEPVELALLLPRSAAVGGTVLAAGATARDARVVVRQDHDVVDEVCTTGDGHYRFDDLAEGTYSVFATAGTGRAVARVSLAEGADVHVDLDLGASGSPDRMAL